MCAVECFICWLITLVLIVSLLNVADYLFGLVFSGSVVVFFELDCDSVIVVLFDVVSVMLIVLLIFFDFVMCFFIVFGFDSLFMCGVCLCWLIVLFDLVTDVVYIAYCLVRCF